MILVDALYINDSGGKILLDYLISELEMTGKSVHYLLDERVTNKIPEVNSNKVEFLKASLSARNNFYKNHKNSFSTVLCFGNLPPNVKISAKVYTYFHQLLFLKLPENMAVTNKFSYYLKTKILNHFKKNTDFWLVQTSLVKDGLSKKYKIPSEKILEMPFYPPFPTDFKLEKKKNSYLYVSNATPHKNHQRLIEAFAEFYKKYKIGELTLTVSEEFPELINLIQLKQNQGVPIKNIGFIPREILQKLYAETEFLIFPSLTESFGLGLVEAIENNCKIIGADLPYTFAICEPSLTFNPLQTDSIVEALSLSLHYTKPSVSKVKNEISAIINLLN